MSILYFYLPITHYTGVRGNVAATTKRFATTFNEFNDAMEKAREKFPN